MFAAATAKRGPGPSLISATGPAMTLADHLGFALRHEDIDLLILKRVFEAVPQAEIEAIVRAAPTGIPARRAWYLYETLTGRTLDVDDAPRAAAIDLLDPEGVLHGQAAPLEAAPRARQSPGHRPVLPRHPAHQGSDGIPGTRPCRQGAGNRGAHGRPSGLRAPPVSCCWPTAARASRSRASARRATGWSDGAGRSCKPARTALTLDEIIRLQRVLIEDTRFVRRRSASATASS